MTGPSIKRLKLWQRHEQRVLAVLRGALRRLHANGVQGRDETDLTADLLGCMLEENEQIRRSGGDYIAHPPFHDGLNPLTPAPGNSTSGRKRPDLQWQIIDPGAPQARYSVRSFAIECKRLGDPPPGGQNLSGRYVGEGVRRFKHPGWQYGRDTPTGVMVGYVQSSPTNQVSASVNGVLRRRGFPALTPVSQPGSSPTEMDHSFDRSFDDSPFRLIHLWTT